MTQPQLLPTSYNNHSLFSGFYLDELVLQDSHWQRMAAQVHELRQQIAQAYEVGMQGLTEETPEAEVERRLIRPILTLLGHHFYVQKNVPTPEGQKYPDYAFFSSGVDRITAEGQKDRTAFFQNAIAVGEAKRWDRPLDRRLRGTGDPFTNQNPSYQIDFYLRATGKTWGILTNGRLWRLYYRDLSYRLDVYYEVNLPDLLMQSDEAFLYFLAFFCKDAFLSESTGEAFLNRAYKQSIDYAVRLGDELKENVYEALRLLVEGFLRYPSNHLGDQDVAAVREHAFTAIYRLLFVFYSESPRKSEFLLPMDNITYRNTYSLRALAEEVTSRLDNNVTLSPTATTYWARLQELFRLIDEGDAHLGVPTYNGGLFDKLKHPFLVEKRVGDAYLARAIDLLARATVSGQSGRGFVTYGDLGVRELGSIYEGLLEHQPRVAQEPMVAVRDDKGERVVREKEAQGKKILAHYDTGQVYLTLHQGERKATGSYYTPDYIVKYIVQNTLGPLLEEISQRGDDQFDSILALKVLDPAMGSGHFLVEATDYLARALVEALGEASAEREDDIRWARREIVERCIYGVDLNPLAVELAKLSLWLHTVSRDKPLNFLDHHLRCGNSLIGAWIADLGVLPEPKKKAKSQTAGTTLVGHQFSSAVAAAVNSFYQIMEAPSATIEDIHRKESAHKTALYALSRVKAIADAWTSVYFENEFNDKDAYERVLQLAEAGTGEWPKPGDLPWVDKARQIAEVRRFFHWELEFPEIFFDRDGRRLPDGGFSAVVGNPPYDVIAKKEQEMEVEPDKAFYASCPDFLPATGSKLNFYRLFVARSVALCQRRGCHGFIVPMTLLGDSQAAPLRKYLLTETQLLFVEAFPQKDDPTDRVFPDAKLSTCLYILKKSKGDTFQIRIHPGRLILEASPAIALSRHDLELFDPEGLSIPSYPGTTAHDVALAVKLSRVSLGHKFGDVAPSQQGEVNLTTHSSLLSDEPLGPEVLRGAHVDRYELKEEPKQGSPKYLKVEEFLKGRKADSKAFDHSEVRIGYQRGAAIDNWRRVIACVIEEGQFCSDTVNYIVRPKWNLFTILGLLNSTLYEWRFRLTSTNNHVNSYEVDGLPLRLVNFTTASPERKRLVTLGKSLYEQGLERQEFTVLLNFVSANLTHPQVGAPEVKPDNSDVIHDVFAFLAEAMTRLHKEKQLEVKNFLLWLETYLGASVDDLKNRTKLREYWKSEATWDTFRDALMQNKGHITKVKLPGYEAEQPIRDGFDLSRSKLQPMLDHIERTDWLIDQIVYKLYGLTDEEIAIVGRRERAVYARERG